MSLWETQIARIWGVPIRVHLSLWLLLPIFAVQFSPVAGQGLPALGWGLVLAVGLFTSVALHELGHTFVAIRLGFPVREILLLPIGGAAQLERAPSRPAQEFFLALAGPLVSLLLAALCWYGARGVAAAQLGIYLFRVLQVLAEINLMLMLFNLLPAFPMDGGRILRALLTPGLGRLRATRWAVRIGKLAALVFGVFAVWPPMNLLLLVIAFFLYTTAGAEYRLVLMEERRRATGWEAPPIDAEYRDLTEQDESDSQRPQPP